MRLGPAHAAHRRRSADSLAARLLAIAHGAGRSIDAKILLLAPDAASGFVREWRPDVFPPERHRGYAFTWFTLAAVVVIVFVGMHWRKDNST